MPNKSLRWGTVVDIQGALELALGGTDSPGKLAGIDLNRINPVTVVREAYKKHGIKIIELPADANYVIPGIMSKKENVEGLQRVREEFGLEYTIHLPFFQQHLCSLNTHIRKASIETQVETINACETLGGINNYVLHLTSELEDDIGAFDVPRHYKDLAWGLFLDKGRESIEEIIARTGITPAKICVENNEGIPFSATYDILLDEFRDMRICLDVGHLILQGDEQPSNFVKKWKDRVGEIHFHNVLYKKIGNRIHSYDDHHGITKGVLDVIDFLNLLESINFKAPVLLEIMTQREIVESITFLREHGFL